MPSCPAVVRPLSRETVDPCHQEGGEMPVHVFVDESKSKGFLMAAARCPAEDVAVHRKALRGLLLPGQERLHFRHETDARRKQILQVVSEFTCSSTSTTRNARPSRRATPVSRRSCAMSQAPRPGLLSSGTSRRTSGTAGPCTRLVTASTAQNCAGTCWLRSLIRCCGCRTPSPGRGRAAATGDGEWPGSRMQETSERAKPGSPTVRKAAGFTSEDSTVPSRSNDTA